MFRIIELTDRHTGLRETLSLQHIIRVTENREYCYIYCTDREHPMSPKESYEEVIKTLRSFTV